MEAAPRRKRSRCRCALGLALLFDALGLAGLLLGGLLETEVSDLLIYLGGVAVFFSLPWWVFWHVGNLEVPAEELRDDVGLALRSGGDAWSMESWRARRLARLARVFSTHFSLPSASASASVPSQVGRPRAHFAAPTGGIGRPSETEKLQEPSQESQEGVSPLESSSQPSSLFSSAAAAAAGTTAPQELPETPETQDRGTQTSFFKIIGRHKKT
ncbi:transmembrane protein 238-like [Ahaetulla prasina]|uniref:transmembrane protein 238-like n=1 Tax=Ahaetulla prasina TaxID=499056 RepID=UPI002648CE2F|nr:transmembrane protein 238-like [Ahaetulla prasina]